MDTATYGFSPEQYNDEAYRESVLNAVREEFGPADEEQTKYLFNGEEVENLNEADYILVVFVYLDV